MDEFTRDLLHQIAQAEQLGVRMARLKKDAETYGGVKTARELLRKNRLSDGFDQLEQLGKLELSLEALVVKGKYGALFTDDEVNRCFDRLCIGGYYTVSR